MLAVAQLVVQQPPGVVVAEQRRVQLHDRRQADVTQQERGRACDLGGGQP
jgi:hypothetical protein